MLGAREKRRQRGKRTRGCPVQVPKGAPQTADNVLVAESNTPGVRVLTLREAAAHSEPFT